MMCDDNEFRLQATCCPASVNNDSYEAFPVDFCSLRERAGVSWCLRLWEKRESPERADSDLGGERSLRDGVSLLCFSRLHLRVPVYRALVFG